MLASIVAAAPASAQSAAAKAQSPAGSMPRMPDGKPDFSGVWQIQVVGDMAKGIGELPYTEWGKQRSESRLEEFDYTAHCLPAGYTRAMAAPMPAEIVQRTNRIVFLYEWENTFHVVFMDGRDHPGNLEPTWRGHSIGHWEGDTLVVDSTGFNDKTILDAAGHPHSGKLHVVERFQRTDATHLAYEITIDDPVAYTKPWKNNRVWTLKPDWELMEYSCMENNKDLTEGHIK